ncbi:hypothetical protein PM082_022219 [Marasmius tenuissimus]|nr:hypothetical protein PM082_022219 [Marasmius tenuissimus]
MTISELKQTSVGYLASSSLIQPNNSPPKIPEFSISPVQQIRDNTQELLDLPTCTLHEHQLQDALRKSIAQSTMYQGQALQLQATCVMQNLYCDQVWKQLLAKEEKGQKIKRGKLMGDGLLKMLTSDEYYQKVVEHEEAQKVDEEEKRARKTAREKQAAAMTIWEGNEAKKERNEGRHEEWKKAVKEWEMEHKEAKDRGETLKVWERTHPKPKVKDPDYAPEPAVPKPTIRKKTSSRSASVEAEGEDDADGNSDNDNEENRTTESDDG